MNAEQRKKIETIVEKVNALKSEVETLREEEQTKYDNLPEGLQQGTQGEAMTNAIEYLEMAESSLDEAVDHLQTIE